MAVFDVNRGNEITELFLEIEPHESATLNNHSYVIITNYGDLKSIGKSISVINANTYEI